MGLDYSERHEPAVAMTCANATKAWKLYIDGELKASKTAPYSFADQGSHFTIGGRAGGNYVNAAFDDVRLYDKILPTQKIKAIYNGGAGSEEELGSPILTQHQTLAVGDAECIVASQNVTLDIGEGGATIFAQQSLFMAT